MTKISRLVATFISLSFCIGGAGAVDCTRASFQQLNDDASETTLYKDTMVERACVGRKVRTKGTVLNVDDPRALKITAEDGFDYRVILSPAHNCGNMLTVKKGQKIQVGGTVTRVYLNTFMLIIGEAYCVAPIN